MALALLAFLKYFRAQDVGGHQVGGELHALFGKTENAAQRRGKLSLGEARGANKKRVTARQDGGERQLDDLRLAEDHPAHGGPYTFEAGTRGFKIVDDLPVGFIDAGHGSHYSFRGAPEAGSRYCG